MDDFNRFIYLLCFGIIILSTVFYLYERHRMRQSQTPAPVTERETESAVGWTIVVQSSLQRCAGMRDCMTRYHVSVKLTYEANAHIIEETSHVKQLYLEALRNADVIMEDLRQFEAKLDSIKDEASYRNEARNLADRFIKQSSMSTDLQIAIRDFDAALEHVRYKAAMKDA